MNSDAPALSGPALRAQVERAYELLGHASQNSGQLPDDVVIAVTTASHALREHGCLESAEDETRFWNAYSLLLSNKLADQARHAYRQWLYVVLALLLVTQIYYLAGALTVNRLMQVEDEWQGKAAAAVGSPVPEPAAASTPGAATTSQGAAWEKLRRFGTAQANYYLGKKLLVTFNEVAVPADLIPADYDPVKANFMANYMKLRAELELILLSLSGYILPLLYGTLGAFAYVLRRLSDPVTKLNFGNDTRSTYTFRIHIGALGGLAVGWFINGNAPISGISALSPLALAFAAGYGSDLLFTMLDKVVGAFAAQPGLQTSVKSETTQRGGITIRTDTQRHATVSGTVLPSGEPIGAARGHEEAAAESAKDAPPPTKLHAAA